MQVVGNIALLPHPFSLGFSLSCMGRSSAELTFHGINEQLNISSPGVSCTTHHTLFVPREEPGEGFRAERASKILLHQAVEEVKPDATCLLLLLWAFAFHTGPFSYHIKSRSMHLIAILHTNISSDLLTREINWRLLFCYWYLL